MIRAYFERTLFAPHRELYGPHRPERVVAGVIAGGLLIVLVMAELWFGLVVAHG